VVAADRICLRLPTGHSLMVSMPTEVAALLDKLASAVDNA
jgi:hypothetical protein